MGVAPVLVRLNSKKAAGMPESSATTTAPSMPRPTRIVGVGGDEGVEGEQLHLPRKAVVPVTQLGQGVFAPKIHALKVGQTGHIFPPGTPAKGVEFVAADFALIGSGQIAVEDAGVNRLPVPLGPDGEVGEAVYAAFVGPVENLPVDQPPVAGQPDAAGSDAAQGKADLAGLFVAIEEVVHWVACLWEVGE